MFVNNTGQVPDMVIFSCALWDIARCRAWHSSLYILVSAGCHRPTQALPR